MNTTEQLMQTVKTFREKIPFLLYPACNEEGAVPIAVLQFVGIKDERYGTPQDEGGLMLIVQPVELEDAKKKTFKLSGEPFDIITRRILKKHPNRKWSDLKDFSYPICTRCGYVIDNKQLLPCKKLCEHVYYCSEDCRVDDWVLGKHMETCNTVESRVASKVKFTKRYDITKSTIYWGYSMQENQKMKAKK